MTKKPNKQEKSDRPTEELILDDSTLWVSDFEKWPWGYPVSGKYKDKGKDGKRHVQSKPTERT